MFVVKISIKNSMEIIKDVKWQFILYKKDKGMLVSLVRKGAWFYWGKEKSSIAQMSKHYENIRNFQKCFPCSRKKES